MMVPLVRSTTLNRTPAAIAMMSNSFGFGGTNATLVFKRFND